MNNLEIFCGLNTPRAIDRRIKGLDSDSMELVNRSLQEVSKDKPLLDDETKISLTLGMLGNALVFIRLPLTAAMILLTDQVDPQLMSIGSLSLLAVSVLAGTYIDGKTLKKIGYSNNNTSTQTHRLLRNGQEGNGHPFVAATISSGAHLITGFASDPSFIISLGVQAMGAGNNAAAASVGVIGFTGFVWSAVTNNWLSMKERQKVAGMNTIHNLFHSKSAKDNHTTIHLS